MQELYIKELASCCRNMLIYNKDKNSYALEVKGLQKELRKNIYALLRNKDFKLKIKLAIIFFLFPYNICRNFKFLLK